MKSLSFLYRNARFADVDVVLKLAPHVQTNSKHVVTRMGPSTPNATVNSSQRVETPLTDVAADAASSRTELGADTLAKSQADETVHKIESTELKRFPGHLAVLCQSDFFDAQVSTARLYRRWPHMFCDHSVQLWKVHDKYCTGW